MFSKKHFLIGAAFGIILLIAYLLTLPDTRLHLVFCDVGQGDAAYIRAPNGMDMLIDGGPNNQVLSCLGKHMPFWDRAIDVVMLTHPQIDHLQGLIPVIERYTVNNIVIGVTGNDLDGYRKLLQLISNKNIPVKNLYQGDAFSLGEVRFSVLWPQKDWVVSKIQQLNNETMKQLATVDGPAVLGMSTTEDLNSFSYYLHLKYKDFDALFTGDGDAPMQDELMATTNLPDIELLKFPHHGSKTGILPVLLDTLKPELAIVSVGKKNSYGHPAAEALKLLHDRAIKTRRTDLEGDIEIVTP